MTKAQSKEDWWRVRSAFRRVGAFKDAMQRAEECERKGEEIRKAETEAREKTLAAAIDKKRKTKAILAVAAVVAIVALLLVITVFVPANKCKKAAALLDAGQYEDAIEMLRGLEKHKDCAEIINESNYRRALSLLESRTTENHTEAYHLFDDLGSYKDAEQYLSKFKCVVLRETHNGDDDDDNWVFEYYYNDQGLLEKVIGSCEYWKYDSYNRESVFHQETESSVYSYRGDGSLERVIRSSGDTANTLRENIITDYYNEQGLLTRETWSSSGWIMTYSHETKDGIIWKTTVTGGYIKGAIVLEYDSHGNVIDERETNLHHTFENQYDEEGRLVQVIMKDDDGTILKETENVYDMDGNLIKRVITGSGYHEDLTITYTNGYFFEG